MISVLTDLLVAGLLLLVGFIAHEVGHVEAAKKLGYSTKVLFTKGSFEVRYWGAITPKGEIKVLETGIFYGLLVVLISVLVVPFWSPVVLVVYLFGCGFDWRRLRVLYRNI